ncbi:hypothetical protein EP18_14775 [Lysinibacillus sphaericus]|nr:hypothetical protein [Lysinibacillus sphaericus]KEK10908.1 hypothetical protein EP18_14775 [Lysinibacillus sphaericus]
MNKAIQYVIWFLVLIVINLSAIQIASFSLFTTQEGTSIFSLDYLMAFGVIIVTNLITIQLLLAIRKKHQKGFMIGLIVGVLQAISLYLLINTLMLSLSIILSGLAILVATVLLFLEIKK